MSRTLDRVSKRKIQFYEVHAGPDLVKITVETPSVQEIRVGISIALAPTAPALESSDVDLNLIGTGCFNPVTFPREGRLSEVRTRGTRGAIAAFRFQAVDAKSHAEGLELLLRGRRYRVPFGKAPSLPQTRPGGIPASVVKLLPTSKTARRAKS